MILIQLLLRKCKLNVINQCYNNVVQKKSNVTMMRKVISKEAPTVGASLRITKYVIS